MTKDAKPAKPDPQAHTELRPAPGSDHSAPPEGRAGHTPLQPRTPLDALPELDEDQVEDLFNDMPV